MATPADQLNELIATTLRTYEKSGKVQDQIFNGDPLFALLNAKDKKRTEEGGSHIQVNLRYGKNPYGGSYAGDDVIPHGKTQTVGHALFNWRNYAQSIFVTEDDMKKNRGSRAIVNLWSDKIQEAMDSLQETMTVDAYGDGTGNAGKDMLGLGAIVSATGTLGGIDRATETWWRAQVKDATAGGADPTIATPMMRNMVNTVRGPGGDPQKSGKVDLILMDQELYEAWEGLYESKLQIPSSDLTLGKLGFEALKYKGAEVTWSPNVASGEILFLSTEYMGLRVMQGEDFTFSEAMSTLVNGINGRLAYILWMGQLIVSNCRRLGKLTNVSAT